MGIVIDFEDAIQKIDVKQDRSGKAFFSHARRAWGEVVLFPGVRREYLDGDVGSDPNTKKRQA